MNECLFFPEEIMRRVGYFPWPSLYPDLFRRNQALHHFFKQKCLAVPEEIMMHASFFPNSTQATFLATSASLFRHKTKKAYFFLKK
jgi:hypothetical protein